MQKLLEPLPATTFLYTVSPGQIDGWWAVTNGRGQSGWIAETNASGMRLIQIQDQEFQSTLLVGGSVEVLCLRCEIGGGMLALRRTPGFDGKPESDLVAMMQGGVFAKVIDGPEEADGLIWWKVSQAAFGIEGWTVEVTTSGYRVLFPVE